MLALDDLMRDQNGEVVLFNDSGLRSLGAQHGLGRGRGRARPGKHVTAAGEDVSGFRYLLFANGLRLYYQPGLDCSGAATRTPRAADRTAGRVAGSLNS